MEAKCFIEGCKNDNLLLVAGKFICGQHYMVWHRKEQSKFIKELQDASS